MRMDHLYGLALRAYPLEFRGRFGAEMQQAFRAGYQASSQPVRFLFAAAQDLLLSSIQERFAAMTLSKLALRAAYAAGGTVLFLGASLTVVQAFVIPTNSMAMSLQPGDHLMVNKLAHAPERGEIVVFRYPRDMQQIFIKRVVGLPGDHIRLENKQVIRNGERLTEPYAQHIADSVDSARDNGEYAVPPGTMFVMGDNRDNSLDSRAFGPVPQANFVGRPWFVYWSYDADAKSTRWDRFLLVP